MRFASRPHSGTRRPAVSILLLVMFLLQAIMPAGYMPAPLASGSPVQFCPENASPELMAILHEQHAAPANDHSQHQHQHHHDNHAGHHAMADDAQGVAPEPSWRSDCSFGALNPGFFVATQYSVTPTEFVTSEQFNILSEGFWVQNPRYRLSISRAPPFLT